MKEAATKEAVQVLRCDVRDRTALHTALQGHRFDYVFHLGGYIDHTPFFSGGRAVVDQHLTGTLNLLEALDRDALRGFVYVGSSDEYGDAPAPQVESARGRLISPYAFAKRATAELLSMLAQREALPAVTVRLFLVYGPGQDRNRFLPQLITGCLRGERIPVSPGEQSRDFCYVGDIVEGMVRAACSERTRGEVLNLASGRAITVRQMVETVVRLVGRGTPEFGARPYREGESMALVADMTKTSTLLGWKATTRLSDGLRTTVASFEERLTL